MLGKFCVCSLRTSLLSCFVKQLDACSMAKRLIPLLDRVLIEKLTAPNKSVGGVLLPESATSKYNEGKVLAVGQGRRTLTNGEIIPVAVKEGDKVLLPDYGGTQLKLDGKDYFLFRDEELLGVLTS